MRSAFLLEARNDADSRHRTTESDATLALQISRERIEIVSIGKLSRPEIYQNDASGRVFLIKKRGKRRGEEYLAERTVISGVGIYDDRTEDGL